MTDIEQEIRDFLRKWEQAPEGSEQEAIAKAGYDRLSALQAETGKLSSGLQLVCRSGVAAVSCTLTRHLGRPLVVQLEL